MEREGKAARAPGSSPVNHRAIVSGELGVSLAMKGAEFPYNGIYAKMP